MNNYYVTFSSNHKHPIDYTPLMHYWVKVTAENLSIAMAIVKARFKNNWSEMYEEKDFERKWCSKGEYEHIIQENGKS